jgi:hypothetical protein
LDIIADNLVAEMESVFGEIETQQIIDFALTELGSDATFEKQKMFEPVVEQQRRKIQSARGGLRRFAQTHIVSRILE